MRTMKICAGLLIASVSGAAGQAVPPKSISELAAEFAGDPYSNDAPILASAGCAQSGTWQRELLQELLVLPYERARTTRLAIVLGLAVVECDIDFLDAWFRERLDEASDPYIATHLATALGQSDRPLNQERALKALFEERFDDELRSNILYVIARDAEDPYATSIDWIARGYTTYGGNPPYLYLANVIAHPRGKTQVAPKRALLEAVMDRPDGAGAVEIMNVIMSDALTYDRSSPWFQEIAGSLEAIASGDKVVSSELLQFVSATIDRFRIRN